MTNDEKVARVGTKLANREIDRGIDKALAIGIQSGAIEDFNRRLLSAGLIPEALADMTPITVQLGLWMGEQLRDGVPLNDAIADIDIVAAAPIETLLDEQEARADRVRVVMLKAALTALEECCLPGRVVEAATVIIQTTMFATDQALKDALPTA